MKFIWLHGFASGPGSSKGTYVRSRLAERGVALEIPDLNLPSFRDLTVSRMLAKVTELAAGQKVVLFGSSLGGFTAATWAARNPERCASVILLAPAFALAPRWAKRMGPAEVARWRAAGEFPFEHYVLGGKHPLSVGFLEDAKSYEDFPLPDAPTLVIQGTKDDVVEPGLAAEFTLRMRAAHEDVHLVELDQGHELNADLPRLWTEIERHLGPLLPR